MKKHLERLTEVIAYASQILVNPSYESPKEYESDLNYLLGVPRKGNFLTPGLLSFGLWVVDQVLPAEMEVKFDDIKRCIEQLEFRFVEECNLYALVRWLLNIALRNNKLELNREVDRVLCDYATRYISFEKIRVRK